MYSLQHITILLILFSLSFGCEKYDDDPVFPASAFISDGKYQGEYWPTFGWRTCAPDEVGMDPKKLKELNEEIRLLLEMNIDIHSLLIVKDGYIVAEQYYSDEYGPEDLHRIYSCTKSLTSAMLGIASGDGLLGSLDQTMVSFFPEYEIQNMTEEKQAISIEHLLTMSAGLEWYELEFPYSDQRNSFRKWSDSGGGLKYVLDRPMVAAPGDEYSYNTGISHVLSGILQKVSGVRADSFAMEHLFAPLGVDQFYWPIDSEGTAYGGSGVRLRPRDMARFGYLYLNNGSWEGKQIIPESWVESSQQKHMERKYIPDSYYGYQFWVSNYNTYSAVGYGGQWITIVPEHDLVVVCNNSFVENNGLQWNTPERLLTTYIIPSLQ
jgi:CubicO group peptidase (beta-lactamase class C family)